MNKYFNLYKDDKGYFVSDEVYNSFEMAFDYRDKLRTYVATCTTVEVPHPTSPESEMKDLKEVIFHFEKACITYGEQLEGAKYDTANDYRDEALGLLNEAKIILNKSIQSQLSLFKLQGRIEENEFWIADTGHEYPVMVRDFQKRNEELKKDKENLL